MAKVSISIDAADLKWLRARARRFHDGNLSGAVGELVRQARHSEALGAMLDDLGAPVLSPEEVEEVVAELEGREQARRSA